MAPRTYRLLGLAMLIAGVLGGFAIYAFGFRDHSGNRSFPTASVTKDRHVYTLHAGDEIRVPAAATRCLASGEGGVPNLFCERVPTGRYEVVFYKDSFLVWSGPDKAVSYR